MFSGSGRSVFVYFIKSVLLDLAGLPVVCANDGLDVDLLVSSSLVGWEDESDLCVLNSVLLGKDKDKTESERVKRQMAKTCIKDIKTNLLTCFWQTQGRKPQLLLVLSPADAGLSHCCYSGWCFSPQGSPRTGERRCSCPWSGERCTGRR